MSTKFWVLAFCIVFTLPKISPLSDFILEKTSEPLSQLKLPVYVYDPSIKFKKGKYSKGMM